MTLDEIFDDISTAWTEGRLENVLERQKQLLALHRWILKNSNELDDAVQKDLGIAKGGAGAEITATLDSIRNLYDELDFPRALQEENNAKNVGSYTSFKVPLGPTVIAQASSSPIFSGLVALATALAAGNPTIVLSSSGLSKTNQLLGKAVKSTLDREAIHFVEEASDSARQTLTRNPFAVAVLQDLDSSIVLGPLLLDKNPKIHILEPYYGVPVGIIDRSASSSLSRIVKHISLAASSPATSNQLRVPRLYLVDEFVITSVKDNLIAQSNTVAQRDEKHQERNLGQWLQNSYGSTVLLRSVSSDDKAQVLKMRGSVIRFANGRELLLIPTSSLDYGIDLINKINNGTGAQAIYIFGGGKEAFYLGKFITASHVFVNHIPLQSLAIVAARSARSSIECAYDIDDFNEIKHFEHRQPTDPIRSKKVQKIQSEKVKQYQGGGVSYFEQGLVLGAAMGLVSIVGLGFLSYRGFRFTLG